MAKYRKVDPRIWNDAKFQTLSDDGKLVLFFLLTHPHMTALGAMRHTIAGMGAELDWSHEAFREAFEEVQQQGIVKHDAKACMVWLPKFLRYNPPESPNVLKAWSAAVDTLPECDLFFQMIREVKDFSDGMSEGFRKAFRQSFGEASLNQEQEPEPKPEPEDNTLAAPRPRESTSMDLSDHEKPLPQGSPLPASTETPGSKGSFERFWHVYPKKAKKKTARDVWRRKRLDERVDELIADIQRRQFSDRRWIEGFIPDPTTYLNQERWDDAIEPPRSGQAATDQAAEAWLAKRQERVHVVGEQ